MAELKKRYCSAVNECSKVLCIEWQINCSSHTRYNKLAKLATWPHQEIRMLMQCFGELAEWSMAVVLKTTVRIIHVPGVRIPYSPRVEHLWNVITHRFFTSESLVPSVMITCFYEAEEPQTWFGVILQCRCICTIGCPYRYCFRSSMLQTWTALGRFVYRLGREIFILESLVRLQVRLQVIIRQLSIMSHWQLLVTRFLLS